MKLLSQYNRVTLISTIFIMLVTGFAYYQAISWVLLRQSDKDLKDEEMEIQEYVDINHHLPQTYQTKYQRIAFTLSAPGSVTRRFVDTTYFKKWDENNPKRKQYHRTGEDDPGRGLITSVVVGNEFYRVVIIQSKAETEDLIRIIFSITIGVILLLLIVLFATNRLILNRLWQPFYSIVQELKLFSIADNKEISRLDTAIDEFKDLNKVVVDMASKAKNDYKTLKAFTENASHELNTPIAVISSKLDTLVQTDNFSEQQSKLLGDLYGGVSRLNRLNQSLLLLVKIENQLLNDRQKIDLRTLIEELVSQFQDIFQDKKLSFVCELVDKEIYANRYLMETLLSNLIGNAVRHNHADGMVRIKLTNQQLIISNTGEPNPLDKSRIFMRFHKSAGSEGTGLGLTISKQICENVGCSLGYRFINPYHQFTVDLPA